MNNLFPLLILSFSFSLFAATSNDYLKAKHPPNVDWGYDGQKRKLHPDAWAKTCDLHRVDQHQSPINLKTTEATVENAVKLKFEYSPTKFAVYHNRHTVEFEDRTPVSKNFVTFNNEKYFLKQFHYHRPAEHLIDFKEFNFEIHFVHSNAAGKLLVLGVLGEVVNPRKVGAVRHKEILGSAFGREVTRILDAYQGTGEPEVSVDVDDVDLTALLPLSHERGFFTYQGSLTTPPCTENVTWIVFRSAVQMTMNQEAEITKKKFGVGFNNARRHLKIAFPHLPPLNAKLHSLRMISE